MPPGYLPAENHSQKHESIINRGLQQELDEKDAISDRQYGFRWGRSMLGRDRSHDRRSRMQGEEDALCFNPFELSHPTQSVSRSYSVV